jgi:predicted metalloprotease with PDZ domain
MQFINCLIEDCFFMGKIRKIPENKLNKLIQYLDAIYKDKSNYEIIDNVQYPAFISKTAIRDTTFEGLKKIFRHSVASTQKNSSYYRKGFHLIVFLYF